MQPEKQDVLVKVNGLHIIPNLITAQQQKQLISNILKQPWNTSLKRRTQHYGYQYSYDRKSQVTKTIQIPQWCFIIKHRIQQQIKKINTNSNSDINLNNIDFDQLIVNQYEPGQGINPHIDNINLFKDFVVSLSLGSQAVMIFQKDLNKVEVKLKRCSLIVLEGEARFQWKHSIPSRKSDNGKLRDVRYSLTFRQMKLNQK